MVAESCNLFFFARLFGFSNSLLSLSDPGLELTLSTRLLISVSVIIGRTQPVRQRLPNVVHGRQIDNRPGKNLRSRRSNATAIRFAILRLPAVRESIIQFVVAVTGEITQPGRPPRHVTGALQQFINLVTPLVSIRIREKLADFFCCRQRTRNVQTRPPQEFSICTQI